MTAPRDHGDLSCRAWALPSIFLGFWLAFIFPPVLFAEVTDDQQRQVDQLGERVRRAGVLFQQGRFSDSAAAIAEAQAQLQTLLAASDADLQRLVRPIYDRLQRAQTLLDAQGVELAALPDWPELTGGPASGDDDSDPQGVKLDPRKRLERHESALQRWQRVLPNDEPVTAEDAEFLVLANLPQPRAQAVLERFQEANKQVRKLMRWPHERPLCDGGLVVYALKSRYDYSEFGRMVENRELPLQWHGHWQRDPGGSYTVLSDAVVEGAEDSADRLAVQIVAGACLGAFDSVPRWFAEGVARNLCASAFRREAGVVEWQRSVWSAMQKLDNAESLLADEMDEELTGLLGMRLTGPMLDRLNRRRFDRLITLLGQGQPFEEACAATFAPPATLAKNWLGK